MEAGLNEAVAGVTRRAFIKKPFLTSALPWAKIIILSIKCVKQWYLGDLEHFCSIFI